MTNRSTPTPQSHALACGLQTHYGRNTDTPAAPLDLLPCPRCRTIDTPTLGPGSGPHYASARCAYAGPHRSGPGAGPHYQQLLCVDCGAFLRWLPRPLPVAQEEQP